MTRFVASPAAVRPQATSRVARARGVACGALIAAFGLFAGFPTPAAAHDACSGVQGTLSRPGNAHYVCRANCSVLGGYGYIIRTEYYDGMLDAGTCMDECTRTPGCRAASVEYGATRRDGSPGTHTVCILWRETDFSTMDHPPYPRVRGPAICYRDFSLKHDPRMRIDFDILRRDQYRPDMPVVSGPGSSQKK